MYQPLPNELRLGFSDIHDIGVFAKEDIESNIDFLHVSTLDIYRRLLKNNLNVK